MFAMETRNRKFHMVHEFTAKEFKAACADAASNQAFHKITANYARKLVKDGYTHQTGFYVDSGAVRYAAAQPY